MAWALLKLIAFFTNLFFFQRWSTAPASPAANHLGWWEVLIPVDNLREAEGLSSAIQQKLKITSVQSIEEALAVALLPPQAMV